MPATGTTKYGGQGNFKEDVFSRFNLTKNRKDLLYTDKLGKPQPLKKHLEFIQDSRAIAGNVPEGRRKKNGTANDRRRHNQLYRMAY